MKYTGLMLCHSSWETLYGLLYFCLLVSSLHVDLWAGYIVFACISTVRWTSTLVSWKLNKQNETWPHSDYDVDNEWEWVSDANKRRRYNVPSFVWHLPHNYVNEKGKLDVITRRSTASSAVLSSKHFQPPQHACSAPIKMWGWMKVSHCERAGPQRFLSSISCMFLTFTGTQWNKGLGGRREGGGGLHRCSVILLQSVLLSHCREHE